MSSLDNSSELDFFIEQVVPTYYIDWYENYRWKNN